MQHYAAAASRWNDDPRLDQKAVSDQEAELALQKAAGGADTTETKCRRVLRFDTMQAQTAYKEPAYCGVHLYCGAKAEQEELIFPGRPIRPTPCAYLALEPKEEICVSFEVYIPKAYDCGQAEKCGDAQPGRLIELRCGTLDKVKLKFYNTGEIAVFQGSMWSPVCPNIGHVRFDAWNTVEICAGKTAAVTVNGVTTENLSCTISGRADGLFFDGTMFPRGTWRVRHITVDGAPYPFVANTAAEKAGEPHEVTLPYAVGSVQNRDRRLYLSKTFTVDDFDAAILHIETLDPCGKAWINGHLVLETDTFTENNVDITNYLQKGTNELKILVEPRAPEVYYFWHRHNDCYNGWFCGAVSVTLCAKQRITYMKVQTDSVHPHVKGHAEIKINENFCGSVRLYASKCFPEKGEEFWLGENAVSGKTVSIFFETAAQLWNTDTPVLYHIRAELVDKTGAVVDDYAQETGFRTICQKDGGIYLNDERILLNGALLMQFLPPFDEVPVNHNCPSGRQIAMQVMMLKKMNGNFMRLHLLGYGTNDARYARICDRLGMMLIWTTRFIDSLEELVWDDGMWREQNAYLEQVKAVINHPSIIMFEGSNEYHAKDIRVIDRMYDYFVDAMRSVDTSRLLTPCSHLYYGGGIYELGCSYYAEDGTMNQDGAPVRSGHGWVDPSVVRSAHTYEILCGYGTTWEGMRKQPWRWQPELLYSRAHSYLITEFAITALANPNTHEAQVNPYIESYERDDENDVIGGHFAQSEWRESQALQALCAQAAVKHMRLLGVDGMAWCCLSSGANNGSYMKPPIDFYGYKKLGFYALRSMYAPVCAAKCELDVSYAVGDSVTPVILKTAQTGIYTLTVTVTEENGKTVDQKKYEAIDINQDGNIELAPFIPQWQAAGYYTLRFDLEIEK